MYTATFVAGYANNSCGMSADIVRKVNFEDPIPRVGSVSSITSGDNGQSSRRRMSIVRSLNKEAVLALGEDLRQTLHDHFPGMVKDRRYHLKTYTKLCCGIRTCYLAGRSKRSRNEKRSSGDYAEAS